jgi:hypothetical protein
MVKLLEAVEYCMLLRNVQLAQVTEKDVHMSRLVGSTVHRTVVENVGRVLLELLVVSLW